MGVTIRRAGPNPQERLALASMRRRWEEEDAGGAIHDPGFEARAVLWIEANETHRLGWIAADGDEVVGRLTIVVVQRMPQPGRADSGWGYLHHFFVVPERRDGGVGAELLGAAVAEARRRGWEHLVLNPRARSLPFYARHGFERSNTLLVKRL